VPDDFFRLDRPDEKTRLLAVIGDPVSHSLSPRIHNRFASSLKLPYVYLALPVTRELLEGFTAMAKQTDMAGFNVTMPHKESIIPFMDHICTEAQICHAVNTVVIKDGFMIGHNTDGAGFLMSLVIQGISAQNKKAVILGAGGAAKAIALALSQSGADVRMASRHADRDSFSTRQGAECTTAGDSSQTPPAQIGSITYFPWSDISREVPGCSMLINATPLGMHDNTDNFHDFSFLDSLEHGSIVYDLIYNPYETDLLTAAKERSFTVINGVSLLVCQAALSFELFTGHAPSSGVIHEVLGEINVNEGES